MNRRTEYGCWFVMTLLICVMVSACNLDVASTEEALTLMDTEPPVTVASVTPTPSDTPTPMPPTEVSSIPTETPTESATFTLTSSRTPTATTTQTPIPGPPAEAWTDGQTLMINNTRGAWLRPSPDSNTNIVILVLVHRRSVVITGSAVHDGVQWWWPVRVASSETTGWVEQASLIDPTTLPTAAPTRRPPTARPNVPVVPTSPVQTPELLQHPPATPRPDQDGDGFPDSVDACPAVPGPVGGCPRVIAPPTLILITPLPLATVLPVNSPEMLPSPLAQQKTAPSVVIAPSISPP